MIGKRRRSANVGGRAPTNGLDPKHRKTLEYIFRMGDVHLRVFEITKTVKVKDDVTTFPKPYRTRRETMISPALRDLVAWRYVEYTNPQKTVVRITEEGKTKI